MKRGRARARRWGLAMALLAAMLPLTDRVTAEPAPVVLGMHYVAPPHVPGAKVRTPEGLAPVLAERLAKALPLRTRVVSPDAALTQKEKAEKAPADLYLLPLSAEDARRVKGHVIPTGYRAGIMAIMRTDTDIHAWEDLRDRTVCLAEGSGLAGQLAARHGAREIVTRAPADALLKLRIGECDASVHDSTLLEALLQFPEWQKFSARLPVLDERDLSFIVPDSSAAPTEVLQQHVQAWQEGGVLAQLTEQAARDIAFEVYMDQEVPDCH